MHYRIMAKYHEDSILNFHETWHGKDKWKKKRGKGSKDKRLFKREWIASCKMLTSLATSRPVSWRDLVLTDVPAPNLASTSWIHFLASGWVSSRL